MPKSGCFTSNINTLNNIKHETIGDILFILDIDKKCAFNIIKNGFNISLGCSAKKPKFIHLFDPLISLPNRIHKISIIKKIKKPKYDMFNILDVDIIEQKIMIKIDNIAKKICLCVK